MHWHKITLMAGPDNADELEQCLWANGAVAITFTDSRDVPIFEPGPGETPLWDSLYICGLFDQDKTIAEVVDNLEADGTEVHRIEALQDKVWERQWLKEFKPKCFGQNLWVVPTAYEIPVEARTAIRLDPGLAFGTGTHATTGLILEWLDQQTLKGKRVVDYGCGSGILAIAALLLGAEKSVAVDIDPQALTAARDNAVLNGVADRLDIVMAEDFQGCEYDVVLANILAGPLIDLSGLLSTCLRANGDLVLSGVLDSQLAQVQSAYLNDINFVGQTDREGWVCAHGKRCY
jgi:ribosomal protein L11 methyltransferase